MAAVQYHYGKFPPASIDWERLIPLIGPSAAAVARFDGLLQAMPNPDVLLSPLTTNEAVLSSRIEGTQATMGEVLEYEAGRKTVHEARREDIQEVLNYRAALREAQHRLETMPLSGRVIKEAHRVLLEGVRGKYKSPRTLPNRAELDRGSRQHHRDRALCSHQTRRSGRWHGPLGALLALGAAGSPSAAGYRPRGVRGATSVPGWQRSSWPYDRAALHVASGADSSPDLLHQCVLRRAT